MTKKKIEKPESIIEEAKTDIEQEKITDGFVALYLKPVGKWKQSGTYRGVLERRMKTVSFIIPSNEIDIIERYKNIAKNGIPTEAELIRAGILRIHE